MFDVRYIISTLQIKSGNNDEVLPLPEDSDLRTELKLYKKMVLLIANMQMLEEKKLRDCIRALRILLTNSKKLQSFDSGENLIISYIRLFFRAPNGLNNVLSSMDIDIKNLIDQMKETLKNMKEMPIFPYCRKKCIQRYEIFKKMHELSLIYTTKYTGLYKKISEAIRYLKGRCLKQRDLVVKLEMARDYLKGRTKILVSEFAEMHNRVMSENLAEPSPRVDKIMRDSFREAMKKRGIPRPLKRKKEVLDNLMCTMELMGILKKHRRLTSWFQNYYTSEMLIYIRIVDLKLYYIKEEIRRNVKLYILYKRANTHCT